jgi:trehalose 6-phosphate synthase/phosphatase
MDLQLLEGNKVIEIKHSFHNKGTAARYFLDRDHFDFILAIGDDTTDESLFIAMPESAYTVKIGANISFAEHFLRDQSEIYDFLNLFLKTH